ncbi:MAG: DUF503 domain-containing protein [Deltaproteobacteria bacterium]|nr:DUF503 domain-containing protein [Deltaproteobacteria bacterium]
MILGVSVCELHLPSVRSLKGKRKIVKGLVERIHHRYRVSIAETKYHDLHQRAEISVAIVGNREQEVEELLESVHRIFEAETEAYITQWAPSLLLESSL